MDFRKDIINALKKEIKKDIELEVPPDSKLGDFAFPCFILSAELKKAPNDAAKDLAKKLKIKGVECKAAGPYLNFFVDKQELMKDTLTKIHKEKDKYGSSNIGKNKTVIIEYSSPNIAKPFGIAHIRSTVIGDSLYKIHKFLGYKTLRLNHLGDWGTQFGKLIVAFKKWGNHKRLEKEGIAHLLSIYIKFEEESKIDPGLEGEARAWFKMLEDGEKDAIKLWETFRELSLNEFKRYYKKLDVEFDHYHGESFYIDKMADTIEHIKNKTKTEVSDGALIVNLNEMPPLMLLKSDGATTYHTRELATAFYRMYKFKPEKIVYVVGSPQSLHFKQVFKVLDMVGEDKNKFIHVPFGNMSYEGSIMSTRTGNFILLEEVLDKSIELALKKINEKNPNLKTKKEVSEQVGIGAVIFNDLMNDRIRDADFNWSKALDFEGETAPYLQYTHARICSLIKKSKQSVKDKIKIDKLSKEIEIIKQLKSFNDVVLQAYQNYKPHVIARYLLDLAQSFNAYYQNVQILKQEKDITSARLLVADCVRQVIKNGLILLGIQAPNEM